MVEAILTSSYIVSGRGGAREYLHWVQWEGERREPKSRGGPGAPPGKICVTTPFRLAKNTISGGSSTTSLMLMY